MGKMTWILEGVLGLCLLFSGCATVISKEILSQANREVSVADVRNAPDAHKGDVVIWAGEIVEAQNKKEGTVIEIVHKNANTFLRPKDADESSGRFLALYDGYLDVAIYAPGREVTVAGQIQEKRVLPLGEIQYSYPLIRVKEIHLWPPRKKGQEYYYWDRWPRYYPSYYYWWCW
jgi:outer membrane lipoprotein